MHNLHYKQTSDISDLRGFYCGIYEMDIFIQRSLQNFLNTHPDVRNYIVYENGVAVALLTLKHKNITLVSTDRYIETEYIEYLAVRREVQCKGIGKQIIEWIINGAPTSIRHISVDAFISDVTAYTAVPFYEKCGFKAIGKKHPMYETVKMLLTIPNRDR